jgi:eukaryotic-like serine/threonine-protein kinase
VFRKPRGSDGTGTLVAESLVGMNEAPFKEGEILAGKYKVERMIAKGGMGVVVAAMHEGLDQRVALKFLLPDGAADVNAVGRFLREARAAVRLRSEHVAKVLDVGTLDTGSPYIVMEYLEGSDLQALLTERGRLPAHVAVSYVLQACEAIAEAHAHGIVHRDLKPGNLFLTRRNDGTPWIKVLDFGISKQADGTLQGGFTKTSTLMGTPYYISPEQLRSSKNVDARSDIWALGMILYELLTGSVAFPRDTLPELCAAIIYDQVPDFRSHNVDVAPPLVAVILRCLEKSPEQRYQSLAELAVALSPFVVDGGASAERISRILDPGARSPSIQPPPESLAHAPTSPTPSIDIDPALSGFDPDATHNDPWPQEETASEPVASHLGALTLQSEGLPRQAPKPVHIVAGALGAAVAVIALLWMVQASGAAEPIATAPQPSPAAPPPAPIVTSIAAVTPPAPPEASVPAPGRSATTTTTTARTKPSPATPKKRAPEDDEFGGRK